MTLLDLALEYASQGWPVFPCEVRGKQPLAKHGETWMAVHGVLDATTETTKLREWWEVEPEANIGGATGFVADALDIDSKEAMERVSALFGEHDLDVRALPRAQTGGGGRHVFFEPSGLGNRAGVIEGVDWRGKGGYVVLPGSLHPNGNPYRWIKRMAPAPLPDFLVELLQKRASMPAPPSAAETLASAPQKYIKAAIDSELEKLRAAAPGIRNDTLNKAAYALGKMVGAGWISQGRAEANLKLGADACGLEEPEVSRTIRSGLEDGIAHPREAVPEGSGGEIRHGGQKDSEEPHAAQGEAPGAPPPKPASKDERGRLRLMSAADFMAIPDVEPDWLVEGLLIAGGLSLIAAKPKVGKSVLARNLAAAVASGHSFLDRAVKPGTVIYLAHEEKEAEVRRHFRKLGITGDEALFIHIGGIGTGALIELSGAVYEHHPVLVVIDPLFKFTRAKDVSDYAEITAVLDPLLLLARDADFHLTLVHHAPKQERESGDDVLGSTAIFGTVDALVKLRRKRDDSRVIDSIQRYGKDLPESVLRLDEDSGLIQLFGSVQARRESDLTEVILKLLGDGDEVSLSAIKEQIPARNEYILSALNRLLLGHQISVRGSGSRGHPLLYRRVEAEQWERWEQREQLEQRELREQREQRERNLSEPEIPFPKYRSHYSPGTGNGIPEGPEPVPVPEGPGLGTASVPGTSPEPIATLGGEAGTESKVPIATGVCRFYERDGLWFCETHHRALSAQGECPALSQRPAPWSLPDA
jgi:hypothetical protein